MLGPAEMVEAAHWTADHGRPDAVWLQADVPRPEDSGRSWVKLSTAQARAVAEALMATADVVEGAIAARPDRRD